MSHSTDNDDKELIRDMGSAAASAIGWDGSDDEAAARTLQKPARSKGISPKEADRIRRRDEGLLDLLLDIRPASECTRHIPRPKPRRELFPNFWRQGEIAVLIGYPGVGRSILATQIAETIARGQVNSEQRIVNSDDPRSQTAPPLFTVPCSLFTKPRPQAVVYFDFERTAAQFLERYSVIAPNNRRTKYKFARRHQRSYPQRQLASHLRGFGYSRERMLVEALARKAASGRFTTMIVEDLTHLCGVGASANAIREMLRRFKRWSAGENSALIIAEPVPGDLECFLPHSPHVDARRRRLRPAKKLSAILSEADSVFTLNPSTFAPDFRYVKLLKSGSPPYEGGVASPAIAGDDGVVLSSASTTLIDPVQVFRLSRMSGPPNLHPAIHDPHSSDSSLVTRHSSLAAHSSDSSLVTRHSSLAAPFLGLEYVGLSAEEQHLRDYAAEIAKFEATVLRAVEKEERRRKLSAKDALALGVIDGSYQRYLNGE